MKTASYATNGYMMRFLLGEPSEIRTPDNLIKSQQGIVIEKIRYIGENAIIFGNSALHTEHKGHEKTSFF